MKNIRPSDSLLFANKTIALLRTENKKLSLALSEANELLALCDLEIIKNTATIFSNTESIKKAKDNQEQHVIGLEKMMFITSHRVRKPLANIMGITTQLDSSNLSRKVRQLIGYLKQSAVSLDVVTRELTSMIVILQKKAISKLAVFIPKAGSK